MNRKETKLMKLGMLLAIGGALLFLVVGIVGAADLTFMASAAAWGVGTASVVFGAAESAIKRLQARIAELEGVPS